MRFLRAETTTRRARLLFSLMLVLAVLAMALPQPVQAAVACRTYHTVKEGDRTPTIAHTYNLKWIEIAKANSLTYPYKLKEGQRLCIPFAGTTTDARNNNNDDEDEDEGAITSSTTLTVRISGNRVVVVASKFALDSVFKVKVRDAAVGVNGWYELGKMRVDKNDTESAAFTLPRELRDVVYVSVCLKNQTTDELLCRTAVNP